MKKLRFDMSGGEVTLLNRNAVSGYPFKIILYYEY
jgi:hypothetical protein